MVDITIFRKNKKNQRVGKNEEYVLNQIEFPSL